MYATNEKGTPLFFSAPGAASLGETGCGRGEVRQVKAVTFVMIWNIIISNLVEAHGELVHLRDRIFAQLHPGSALARKLKRFERVMGGPFIEYSFFVSLEHAYHHVNLAWNCRNKDEQRAIKCAMRDYLAWEKFPKEFKEFWPPPSRCRGKPREPLDGRMFLTLPSSALDEALSTMDEIFDALGLETGPIATRSMDVGEFTRQMHRLYASMNRAWNLRKVKPSGNGETTALEVRRHSYYPRAFIKFWPKRK